MRVLVIPDDPGEILIKYKGPGTIVEPRWLDEMDEVYEDKPAWWFTYDAPPHDDVPNRYLIPESWMFPEFFTITEF